MCRLPNVENIVDAVIIIIRYNTVTRYAVKLYSREKVLPFWGCRRGRSCASFVAVVYTYTIVFLSPSFVNVTGYFIYLFFFCFHISVCVWECRENEDSKIIFGWVFCVFFTSFWREFLLFFFLLLHWNYDSVYLFIFFFFKKILEFNESRNKKK